MTPVVTLSIAFPLKLIWLELLSVSPSQFSVKKWIFNQPSVSLCLSVFLQTIITWKCHSFVVSIDILHIDCTWAAAGFFQKGVGARTLISAQKHLKREPESYKAPKLHFFESQDGQGTHVDAHETEFDLCILHSGKWFTVDKIKYRDKLNYTLHLR